MDNFLLFNQNPQLQLQLQLQLQFQLQLLLNYAWFMQCFICENLTVTCELRIVRLVS